MGYWKRKTESKDQSAVNSEKKAELWDDTPGRREELYLKMVHITRNYRDANKLEEAAETFDRLGDYEDSRAMAALCRERIVQVQLDRDEEEKKHKRNERYNQKGKMLYHIKMAILNLCVVATVAGCIYLVNEVIIPESMLVRAENMMKQGRYDTAKEILLKIEDRNGCQELIAQCEDGAVEQRYREGVENMNNQMYASARKILLELNGYKDSEELADECGYQYALSLMDSGKYERAAGLLEELGDYKDSDEQLEVCKSMSPDNN